MIQSRRHFIVSGALLLAAVLGSATGCTLFDDYVAGTPFTPDQPVVAITVQGEIHLDRAAMSTETCSPGSTVIWGTAKNTGDLDVDEVSITISAYDSSGGLLGAYRTSVFNGTVTDPIATDPNSTVTASSTASTSLLVEQSGIFEVCTALPYGSVARTEYSVDYLLVETTTVQ